MAKKKKSKNKARKEVLKAQGKIGLEISKKKKDKNFELPLKEIKKDLIKTGIFAILSILVIFLLSRNNIGYEKALEVLKFKS